MSLNQWMHPRNPYKSPPNFKELAIKYPDFRKVVTQDISGKIHLDFHNSKSLACLTTTLLMENFSLSVFIPEDRLIPTLPSRFNYLLWVEDLISIIPKEEKVLGLDIGIGASCIYPLLAVKHLGWRMVGTESNTENFNTAKENVKKNQLDDKISLHAADKNDIFEKVCEAEQNFQFCMCNPPFFKPEKEFEDQQRIVGHPSEIQVSGGEVEFVIKMIEGSKLYAKKIKIFTVLLGHKSSLIKIRKLLQEEVKNSNIASFTTTQFCQGKTMRWGAAWTFVTGTKLDIVIGTKAKNSKSKPFSWNIEISDHLPRSEQNAAKTFAKIRGWLEDIKVDVVVKKEGQHLCSAKLSAKEASWQRQRLKRRKEERKEEMEDTNSSDNGQCSKYAKYSEHIELSKSKSSGVVNGHSFDTEKVLLEELTDGKISEENPAVNEETNGISRQDTFDNVSSDEPFLVCDLFVKWAGNQVKVDICLVEGTAGRENVHQLLQFLKNKYNLNR